MRIAAGVITWRDGDELLIRCLNSVGPFVDELVLVDGLIAGVETDLPAWTPLERFERAGVHVERVYGATQARKRNVLLGTARRLGCDWLLQIDADERLENGELLRPKLAALPAGADYFAIPFQFDELVLRPLGWKCLRVDRWRECVARNGYMIDRAGRYRHTSSLEGIDASTLSSSPWISHHPEERTGPRSAIRLGVIEHELEPAPPGAEEMPPVNFHAARLLQPARELDASNGGNGMSDTPAEPTYYCPECGARYHGPGKCENGHPPADVVALDAAAAAEQGQDAAIQDSSSSTAADGAGASDTSTTNGGAADTTAAPAEATSGPETAAPAPEPAPAAVEPAPAPEPASEPAPVVDHLAAAEGHLQAALAELENYRNAQPPAAAGA